MNSETENRPHTEFQQKVIERSRRGITPAIAALAAVVVVLIIVGFGYLAVSTNWFTTGINQGNIGQKTVTYSTTATYTPPASGQASFQNLGLAAGCQNQLHRKHSRHNLDWLQRELVGTSWQHIRLSRSNLSNIHSASSD